MSKKSTKESFSSPKIPSEHWGVVSWVLLLILLLTLLGPGPELNAVSEKKTKRTNFGFLKKTAEMMSGHLVLSADNITFELDKYLPLLTTIRVFLPQQGTTVFPSQDTSLTQKVFAQLGASNPWEAYNKQESLRGFDIARQMLYNIFSEQLAPQVNKPAQDAFLKIESGRVVEFDADQTGKTLDLLQSQRVIIKALFLKQTEAKLPLILVAAKVKLAETNDLGIAQLVGRGESDFTGSSASRIHNIRFGASRFNGLILKPGEEFSFNQHLGAVTAGAGFKPELVIKSTGTVPELGGGLCQVSTTAFRAALFGGFPITARKNHSYAVKYYAPQGTDATIYPGAVDLKFLNDTGAHLLIITRMEGTKLIFEFYGTSDSRQVAIDGPYQYDKKPDGSMRARLSRTVTRGEEKNTDDFFSRYVSKNLYPISYEFPKPPSAPTAPAEPQQTPPPVLTPSDNNPQLENN